MTRRPDRAATPSAGRAGGTRRALGVLLLGVTAVLAPSVARADAAADAKDLFAQARELRGRGDCAGALPLFQRAYAIYPAGLGSLRNVAECEESLGEFATARIAWLDLGRALSQTSEPRYAGWSEDAEQGAARLAPKVAPAAVPGRPVLVEIAPAPPDAHARRRDGTARRTTAWVALGVGAAGLVGAGISLLVRQLAIGSLHDQGCKDDEGGNLVCGRPSSSIDSTRSRGQAASTLFNVFGVVGAVGLAGGVVLLATTPSRSGATTALTVSPSGVSAIGRF